MTLLEALSAHVRDTLAGPMDQEVLEQVKAHLLDSLGMMLAARDHALTRQAAAAALPGGDQARLAVTAGVACDAIGLDDFDEVTRTHPGAVVVAALLAVSTDGARPLSGRAFLDGVRVGYEMTCRIGELLEAWSLHDRGFHPTAMCGVIGAAAGVAAARDLDPQPAMGVAASLASGVYELDGVGAIKGLQTGWAAQAGIAAAQLAAAGFTPAPTVLEGPKGLLRVLGVEAPGSDAVAAALDPSARVERVSFKPYSHFTDLHPPTAALIELLRDHDVAANDIAGVEVRLATGRAKRLNDVFPPTAPRLARRCPRFALAAVACRADRQVVADPLITTFDGSALHDPDILALGERITWTDDLPTDGSAPAAVVRLDLRDGTSHTRSADGYPGDGRRAATRWGLREVAERFALVAPPDAHALLKAAATIEQAADVGDVTGAVARHLVNSG